MRKSLYVRDHLSIGANSISLSFRAVLIYITINSRVIVHACMIKSNIY